MAKKVIGVIGSYRKGHVIDSVVSAILEGAAQTGAETEKIYLIDKNIEFCDNCRACTQDEQAKGAHGKCVHDDDMEEMLGKIENADGIVLASPVNFSTVTALMKRFIERLIVCAYWPWEEPIPKMRIKSSDRTAVLVTSSAAPAFIGRLLMPNALGIMKSAAKCVGAKVVRKFYFGLVAGTRDHRLSDKALRKARKAGRRLLS
jgi:putative NADPH-quinone reductase